MAIHFHRSRTMNLTLTKPGETRAFVFDASIGVQAPAGDVDPDTGMLVDLLQVDGWLGDLAELWGARRWDSLQAVLAESIQMLKNMVRLDRVILSELILVEKRGIMIGWREVDGFLMGKNARFEWKNELYQMSVRELFQEARLFEKISDLHKSLVEDEGNFNLFPDLLRVEIENYSLGRKILLERS